MARLVEIESARDAKSLRQAKRLPIAPFAELSVLATNEQR